MNLALYILVAFLLMIISLSFDREEPIRACFFIAGLFIGAAFSLFVIKIYLIFY